MDIQFSSIFKVLGDKVVLFGRHFEKLFKHVLLKENMDVLIIGAGRTAKALSEEIIRKKSLKKLYLYSRTAKSSKALAYDLESPRVEVIEDLKMVKNPDYIILDLTAQSDSSRDESIRKSKDTYQVRQDELLFNLGPIADLTKDLKNIGKKSTIIVITNPVDEITNYLRIILKSKNIIGFGLGLDSKRYSDFLNEEVRCIGLHGKAIPLVGLKSKSQYNELLKSIDKKLHNYIRDFGIPYNSAGVEFSKFFDKLTGKSKSIVHASIYLKKDYLGVKGISISIPVYVENKKILGPVKVKPSKIEKQLFVEESKVLEKSINHVLAIHKKMLFHRN